MRGIRVVKSFVREDFEEKKFKNVSEDIYDDFVKAEKLLAFNAPLMQFAAYGCMLFISWFGAKLIVASTMTTGVIYKPYCIYNANSYEPYDAFNGVRNDYNGKSVI